MFINHHSVNSLLIDTPKKLILFDHLSHRAKLLLLLIALYSLSSGLSSIFVTLFLFKIDNSFIPPIFFYIGNYLGVMLGFVTGGLLLKKISVNLLLSGGLILEALFFGTLAILGQHSGSGALGLGIFFGISEGFIWLIRHVLEYESTFDGNRNRFFASAYILATLAAIIAPLISGFFIVAGEADHYSGYTVIFILSSLLLMAAGVVSFMLKHEIGLDFKISEIFTLDLHNKDWGSIENSQFVQGLRDGSRVLLVTLAAFFILKNELNVGGAASLGNAISLIIGYLIGRFSKSSQRIKLGWIGSILILAGYGVLTSGFNVTSLIIFILIVSCAGPALYVVQDTFPISSIDSDPQGRKKRITYLTNAEIYINLGRIVGLLVLLLLLNFFDSVPVTRYYLAIGSLIVPLTIYIYARYNSLARKV